MLFYGVQFFEITVALQSDGSMKEEANVAKANEQRVEINYENNCFKKSAITATINESATIYASKTTVQFRISNSRKKKPAKAMKIVTFYFAFL